VQPLRQQCSTGGQYQRQADLVKRLKIMQKNSANGKVLELGQFNRGIPP
jgi:hypothetical protein